MFQKLRKYSYFIYICITLAAEKGLCFNIFF